MAVDIFCLSFLSITYILYGFMKLDLQIRETKLKITESQIVYNSSYTVPINLLY